MANWLHAQIVTAAPRSETPSAESALVVSLSVVTGYDFTSDAYLRLFEAASFAGWLKDSGEAWRELESHCALQRALHGRGRDFGWLASDRIELGRGRAWPRLVGDRAAALVTTAAEFVRRAVDHHDR